jgi:hypothetical protein
MIMARTIGAVRIKKLKAICHQEYTKWAGLSINHVQLDENIKAQIPEEWYDIWESAWSEINRIIDDCIAEEVYK